MQAGRHRFTKVNHSSFYSLLNFHSMTKIIQYRQGDVMLEKISCLPDQPLHSLSSPVIARGEKSNHAHALFGSASVLSVKDGADLYVAVIGSAKLSHILETSLSSGTPIWTGEHLEIDLEEGIYQVVHQREYDPYNNVERRVWD